MSNQMELFKKGIDDIMKNVQSGKAQPICNRHRVNDKARSKGISNVSSGDLLPKTTEKLRVWQSDTSDLRRTLGTKGKAMATNEGNQNGSIV
ncbi:hypothetical protein SNEBB_001207, partial [Seison nebaliae]